MEGLTVIMPFYRNKGMLNKQIEVFNSYPQEVQKRLEFIVVDDCSPIGDRAEEAKLKTGDYDFKLYRILTDLRWNWLQCRNLGAKEAAHDWILMTDIDHIIPEKTMIKIMSTEFDGKSFYTFPRINWADNGEYKPHPNSYLMPLKRFWKVGGYDETYAGHYGTDGMWRRRCEEVSSHVFLAGCPLARVDREDIPDASTKPEVLDRKDNRDPKALEDIRAYKEATGGGIITLRFPWKRII